ncbi:hypothetical protein [Arthrobacter sp. H14]|uniref:hypothetical protein n=1 Tax=Arthrobacter sp. H14 TaxID=1312959 RepID=UPI00047B404C|nr:hypothetical protein [Arthrobacter sp. H14]
MNTNKHGTPSESNSNESAGQASGPRSTGPKVPESEGRESFDEAVTEHLNEEDSDQTAEEKPGGEAEGKRNNQPALEEQTDDGNPAKTDNE